MEESERGSGEPEPLVEPVRVKTMFCTGDLNPGAMMFACEVGRAGNKLFIDTLATMVCRDDETSDSANCRAVWEIGDEFGANQADDLARLLCNEKTASVAM